MRVRRCLVGAFLLGIAAMASSCKDNGLRGWIGTSETDDPKQHLYAAFVRVGNAVCHVQQALSVPSPVLPCGPGGGGWAPPPPHP